MFWKDNVAADLEPYKVNIKRDELTDPERSDRKVPFKVYYPVGHSFKQHSLPVVFWSHGLGGGRDGAGFLSRYISSHGYIVVNVQHPGTDTSLWMGKEGHPWDVIRATHISRKTTLQRFKDIPFLLDNIQHWAQQHDEIGPFADFETLGISGHSFGAMTTQVLAGQLLGKGDRRYSLKEERFKAAISYSPSHSYNRDEPHAEIYGSIQIPTFFMTGTADDSPITGLDYTHRLPIFESASMAYSDDIDHYLTVLEDGDHMVFAGSRGGLGENPKRAMHETIIKILSLAFWDAYLHNNNEALQWLQSDAHKEWLLDEATLIKKSNY